MKRNTLIEHKEVVVCEENGPINLSHNVLLTTLEANTIVKLVVFVITTKSSSTCTNYGKIGHTFETCHNMKREIPLVPTATVKFIILVA
jgi:hypothetical protein